MEFLGVHAVRNGMLIGASEAVLPVGDKAVQYGFGVYESLRVIKGQAIYLDEHLKRLAASALGIDLNHPFSLKQMAAWVDGLIKTDAIAQATMRILLMGGDQPTLTITAHPILSYPDDWYKHGINVTTYPGERLLPRYKTCSLLLNYLALRMANQQEAFEALLVDRYGRVLEGTRSNFFAFDGDVLYTADDSLVLEGVTRDKILVAAAKLGFRLCFDPVGQADLIASRYDELFISSTSMGALPIAMIDGRRCTSDFSRTRAIHALIRQWEMETLH